jgi:hypothetical protein
MTSMTIKKIVLAAVSALILVWMFRWQIVVAHNTFAYRLDRWTGKVWLILGNEEHEVQRQDDSTKKASNQPTTPSERQQRLDTLLQKIPATAEMKNEVRSAFITQKFDNDGPALHSLIQSLPTDGNTKQELWDTYWQFDPTVSIAPK